MKNVLIFTSAAVVFLLILSRIGLVMHKVQSRTAEDVELNGLSVEKPSGWAVSGQSVDRVDFKNFSKKIDRISWWFIPAGEFQADPWPASLNDGKLAEEIYRIALDRAGGYAGLYKGYALQSVENLSLSGTFAFAKATFVKGGSSAAHSWHHIYFRHQEHLGLFSYHYYDWDKSEARAEEEDIYAMIGTLRPAAAAP